jgi:hypothetical protein
MIPVELQLVTTALVPFNETVLLPWVAPNPLPLIWTLEPETPLVGERLVMLGAAQNALDETKDTITRVASRTFRLMSIKSLLSYQMCLTVRP